MCEATSHMGMTVLITYINPVWRVDHCSDIYVWIQAREELWGLIPPLAWSNITSQTLKMIEFHFDCHPLVFVIVVLIIVVSVHFGWRIRDDTVLGGAEQTGSLLWNQQGGGILNAVAFIHIVHLQQEGKDKRNTLRKHKQTTEALTKTRPRYGSILRQTSCETRPLFDSSHP